MARRRLRRVLFWALGLALAALAWKCAWRFGPGLRPGGPALFAPQAEVLLRAHLGLPRAVTATLPAPERGTSAEAQLRLMELWDGRAWTARATRNGRVEGRTLRVAAGRIVLAGLSSVSPERQVEGRPVCDLEARVRWDWPDPDRELLRVAPLVGLRLPAPGGLAAPGQEARRTLRLEREGWSWQPRTGPREPARDAAGGPRWRALAWMF